MNGKAGHSPPFIRGGTLTWLLIAIALVAAVVLLLPFMPHQTTSPPASKPPLVPKQIAAATMSTPVPPAPVVAPVLTSVPNSTAPARQMITPNHLQTTPSKTPVAIAATPQPASVTALSATANTAATSAPVELLMDVHLNLGTQHETDLLLGFGQTPDHGLYAKANDIQRWRLKLPAGAPYSYQGEDYYPLDAIKGLTYRIDPATTSLWISAPPEAFNHTVVDGLFGYSPKPTPASPGGFLNYDVYATRAASDTNANALLEAGIFNTWGVGTSSFLAQNLTDSSAAGTGRQLIRLQTTWTQDHPENLTTLSIGDSVTNGGMTGQAVLFGGIQYGTNFSTQPYLITFPMPMIQGQAALPSTVQLYVNGVLRKTQQVEPGPFVVPQLPVVTGVGTATIVIKDILGREQVINLPFLATSALLKTGLNDYSFSLGKQRENYGVDSDDYGAYIASGLFRHGFNDNFTGEVSAASSTGLQTLSMGGVFSNATSTVFNAALAASHSSLGEGAMALLGFQSQWNTSSAGINVQIASPHFTQVGYPAGQPAPSHQIAANIGTTLGISGSVSLSYIDTDDPTFGRARILSASYNQTVGNSGFLSVTGFHSLQGSSNNGVTVSFTLPFGERSDTIVGVSQQNGITQGFAQVQENLPAGTGSGYRLGAQIGPDPNNTAEYDYQNDVGTYRLGASNYQHETTYAGEAAGGLAFLGGTAFASRQIDGSFGVVEVPGFPNVTVYADNQPVGVTDKNGNAVIPTLRPYQINHISISPENLPLGAEVDGVNADPVPYYGSGVVVKFPVRASHGVTLNLHQPDGTPVPAGATVEMAGKPGTLPVGYDGEVYLANVGSKETLRAAWDHKTCSVSLNIPVSSDPLPDLGVFVCKPIEP